MASTETLASVFASVFRLLRPRTPLPAIALSFHAFAGVTSTVEWSQGRLVVRISDILATAPEDVWEALAWILLAKMLRKPVAARYRDRYRRYLNRRDVVQATEQVRRDRGRKRYLPPQGRFYDLQAMFDELNFRYFHGLMSQPALGWSPNRSRTILGHYDSAHHTIVLSRDLDGADVPRMVVEYVLYHEMLHIRYPVKRVAGKRSVHTPEFCQAEKQFEEFAKAKAWLDHTFAGREAD